MSAPNVNREIRAPAQSYAPGLQSRGDVQVPGTAEPVRADVQVFPVPGKEELPQGSTGLGKRPKYVWPSTIQGRKKRVERRDPRSLWDLREVRNDLQEELCGQGENQAGLTLRILQKVRPRLHSRVDSSLLHGCLVDPPDLFPVVHQDDDGGREEKIVSCHGSVSTH